MSHSIRVLVIEDVNFCRQALVSMLSRLNCNVDSAASGHEALEKACARQYDLILSDIKLEDMEGMTIAETLRHHQSDADRNVPIIALTSYGDDFIKEKVLSSGMDDFIQKPLTFDSAETLLKKWVGDRHAIPTEAS